MLPVLVSASLGALVAIAELISRYRDDPTRAVWSVPAGLYVGANVAGACAAFSLIDIFDWTFGASGSATEATQVLVAGLGSAALFRSSLFNVTAGDQVFGVGPSAVLTVILTAADRAVDRRRARIRASKTSKSMNGVSFESMAESLVMYCFAAMQNASVDEVQAIEDKVANLRGSRYVNVPDQIKAYVLGLSLQAIVGDKVLSEAVGRLRDEGLTRMPEPTSSVDDNLSTRAVAALPPAHASSSRGRLLQILDREGPLGIRELQETSGLELGAFSELCAELKTTGIISVEGRPGAETVALSGISNDNSGIPSAS